MLQLNFSLCRGGGGVSALPWTLPHSCALDSLCSSSADPSPKGQVWGVKFNLKPDRRGWGGGARVTPEHHIAQHQRVCLCLSASEVLSALLPCLWRWLVHIHSAYCLSWLIKPQFNEVRPPLQKNNYAKKWIRFTLSWKWHTHSCFRV